MHTSSTASSMVVAVCLLLCAILHPARCFGGERAFFTSRQFAPNVTHRQDVCDRFEDFYFKRVELRHALENLQLHVGIGFYPGGFFNYDPVTGINRDEPGIIAVLLDELARRGGFTWRNSFGVYTNPVPYGKNWNDTLHWSIDTYDVVADWWTNTRERMHDGVIFIEEFLDSSFVLVTRDGAHQQSKGELTVSSFFNWLKPYDSAVWCMTLFTIFFSGVVYQILEWYADEREDRTMWEWWLENAYLSFINATQAYEYQPKTLASRIFGISMAVWALVMTATYTANLASLLVDRKIGGPQSLEEIAVFGNKICTWAGTPTDYHVRDSYRKAQRIPRNTEQEVYQGLIDGDCEFVLTNLDSFRKNKAMEEFNPHCDMYLVGDGRKVAEIASGFVVKADSGTLCTGFIRDVLNLLMRDIIEEGFLERAWEHEYKRTQTIDCLTYQAGSARDSSPDGDEGRRQLLEGHQYLRQSNLGDRNRMLKSGGKGAAGGAVASIGVAGEEAQMLTLEQMIGTFACHWGLMIIAVIIAHVTTTYDKHGKPRAKKASKVIVKKLGSQPVVKRIGGKLARARGGRNLVADNHQEGEAPSTSTHFNEDELGSKDDNSNMMMMMADEEPVRYYRVEEDSPNEMAEMRIELRELRNQIKELVDITLAPDAHWGASARTQFRLQDSRWGMDDSHVSTSSMMSGHIPTTTADHCRSASAPVGTLSASAR